MALISVYRSPPGIVRFIHGGLRTDLSRRFLGAASEYAVPGSSSPRTKSPKSGPSASFSLNAAIASDCAADDDAAEEDECLVHPSSRQLAWVAEADRGDVASARATAPEVRRAAAAMSADISREVVHERRGIYRVRKRPTRALACVGDPARRLFILRDPR